MDESTAAGTELEEKTAEEHEHVKEELKRVTKQETKEVEAEKVPTKVWLPLNILIFAILGAFYLLIESGSIHFAHHEKFSRFLLTALLCFGAVCISQFIKHYVISRLPSRVSRYNLRRVLTLLTLLVTIFIVISVLFVNWYTAFLSLGLISLILGFALQTPITSLIGWVYILVRTPYRVGDRIKIGDATGDVIDVSYLDTTLWEFGGEYLSSDHPSGRLIKFPNSNVLNQAVYNYSWPLFPYIWNEIKFSIAYESDLNFVATTLQEVASEEIGTEMLERVRVFKRLLARTPVNELDVKEAPVILFRTNPNTWIDVIVRYVVHPKQSGRVKTNMIKKMLERLNEKPELVLFPKSNAR
ncbi:MAG TPA: mechanosensitive ion channel family protein [Acidobacteriota bacterium]